MAKRSSFVGDTGSSARGLPTEGDFFEKGPDDEEGAPGITRVPDGTPSDVPTYDGAATADDIFPDDVDEAPGMPVRTGLHEVIYKLWGFNNINDYHFRRMADLADPNSAKKTKNGFSLDLIDEDGQPNGRSVKWGMVRDRIRGGEKYEAIKGNKLGFKQRDAEAIVTMAVMRGWKDINVSGSQKHQQQLWLAAQHVNMEAKVQHAMGQANGEIPKDEPFVPPLQVHGINVEKLEKSEAYAQFIAEQNHLEEALQQAFGGGVEDIDADTPAISDASAPPLTPEADPDAEAHDDLGGADAAAPDADGSGAGPAADAEGDAPPPAKAIIVPDASTARAAAPPAVVSEGSWGGSIKDMRSSAITPEYNKVSAPPARAAAGLVVANAAGVVQQQPDPSAKIILPNGSQRNQRGPGKAL